MKNIFAISCLLLTACGPSFETDLDFEIEFEASHPTKPAPIRAPRLDAGIEADSNQDAPLTGKACMLLEADGSTPTGERFPCFLGVDWQWDRSGTWVSCENEPCPEGAGCRVNGRRGVCK